MKWTTAPIGGGIFKVRAIGESECGHVMVKDGQHFTEAIAPHKTVLNRMGQLLVAECQLVGPTRVGQGRLGV